MGSHHELIFMYLSGTYGCGATCVQNMTNLGDHATSYSRLGVSEGLWSREEGAVVAPLYNGEEGTRENMADIMHVWARMQELGFIAGDVSEGFPLSSIDVRIDDDVVVESGSSCIVVIDLNDEDAEDKFLGMVSANRRDGGATFFTIVASINGDDGNTEKHFIGCRRIFCPSIKPPQGERFLHNSNESENTSIIRNVHAWLCVGGEQGYPAHLVPEDTFSEIMFNKQHREWFESSLSTPYDGKTVTIKSIIGPAYELRESEKWSMAASEEEVRKCLLMPDIENIDDEFTKLHAVTFISGETTGKMKFMTLSE